jgi:uncharacterized delta-60 repeat protein
VPDNFPNGTVQSEADALKGGAVTSEPMSIARCKYITCTTGNDAPTITAKLTLKPNNSYAPINTADGTTCTLTSTPGDTVRGIRKYSCEVAKQNTLQGKEMFLGVRYRITVTDLKNPLAPAPAPIWKVCGDNCDVGTTTLPSMRNYVQVLSHQGQDTTLAGRSLALAAQNVPSVHRWTLDFDIGNDNAYGVALQPDGKYVVIGEADTDGINHQQVALARYTAYGARDAAFGDGGFVLGGLHDDDAGRAVAIQLDGKIVVAGFRGSTNIDFGVWRFTKDGKPDGTFNLLGFNVADFGKGNDYGQAVLLQPDGKILVAGFAADGQNSYDFALARYNPNGTLDKTFGNDGTVRTNVGSGFVRARDAALQADGKILVAGGHEGDFVVVRYLSDGSLDASFGQNGIRKIAVPGNDEAQAIAVMPSGRIVIAGHSNPSPPPTQPAAQSESDEPIAAAASVSGDFGLALLESDGALCECVRFAIDPILRADFGGDETAYAIALQGDGKIVLAGGKRTRPSQMHLARYRFSVLHAPGYQLDSSFGEGGKKTIALGSHSVARSIAVDANNRMTIAGYSNSGGDNEFAIVRDVSSVVKSVPPPRKIYLPLVQK